MTGPTGEGPEIVLSARAELLQALAFFRDSSPDNGAWPTHIPLGEMEWDSEEDDIWLAAKEAAANGDIEMNVISLESQDQAARGLAMIRGGREGIVRITDKGYAEVERLGLISEEDRAAARRSAIKSQAAAERRQRQRADAPPAEGDET